jgi:hypothetical protein
MAARGCRAATGAPAACRVLSPITREAAAGNIQAFRQALQDLGYAEGENIAVRFAGGGKDALARIVLVDPILQALRKMPL